MTPDESSTAVFNKGTRKGLSGFIPVGGQVTPISTLGDRLLWKKAQKKAKKKQTSDVMKSIMP